VGTPTSKFPPRNWKNSAKGWANSNQRVKVLAELRSRPSLVVYVTRGFESNTCARTLRANIPETPLVLLINEQGEKEKGRDLKLAHKPHLS